MALAGNEGVAEAADAIASFLAMDDPAAEPERKPEESTEEPVEAVAADDEAPADEPEAAEEEEQDPLEAAMKGEEHEEGETEGIETLTELAEAMGTSLSELTDFIKVEEDGEMVPLSAVLATYRANPMAAKAQATAETSRREYALRTEQLSGEHDVRMQQAAELTQALIDTIEADDAQIDWRDLESNDTQEYMRLRMRREDRVQSVNRSLETFKGEQARRKEASDAERSKFRQGERTKLLEFMPEWSDPGAARGAMAKMHDYLTGMGFDAETISGIDDSRMIRVVWSALQHDSAKKSATKKLKGARKLPKVPTLKGAARVENLVQSKDKELDQTYARLRQHGEVGDAARLIEGLLED